MDNVKLELLVAKLDRLQDHMDVLDTKEDLLLKMLDQVQTTLERPAIVEPKVPAWVGWLFGSFAVVGIVSCVILVSKLVFGWL